MNKRVTIDTNRAVSNMMQFTQNEIESEISDIVPRGLRREVARITGIYESVIYGMFNADDERKSYQFGMLQIQAALDNFDPEVGEAHWKLMNYFREMSKPHKPGEVSILGCFSDQLQTFGDFGSQLTNALKDGKLAKGEVQTLQPLVQRLREFCNMYDSIFADAIQKEKIQGDYFGGMPVAARAN